MTLPPHRNPRKPAPGYEHLTPHIDPATGNVKVTGVVLDEVAGKVLDVAHPCWTGVESEFDHDYKIEDVGQGDGIYFQAGWIRVCKCCDEVDEKWDGSEDYYEGEWQ